MTGAWRVWGVALRGRIARSESPEFLRSSLLLAGGAAVFRLLPIALLVVVLASGTPREYGAYSLAFAIVALATVAAEGGVAMVATADAAIGSDLESRLAGVSLRQGIALYIAVVAAGLAISMRDGYSHVPAYVAVGGVGVCLAGVSSVSLGRLQRGGQFRVISRMQVVGSCVGLLVGFVVFALGGRVWALVVQSAVSIVLTYVLIMLTPPGRVRISLSGRLPPGTRRSLHHALGANLLGALGRRADDIFIGLILGPVALGSYALGYRVLTIITEVGLHQAERVTVAQIGLAKLDSFRQSSRLWKRNQILTGAFVGPMFAVAGVGCLFLIPGILGPEWRTAGVCAFILCGAGAIQSTYNLTYSGLYVLIDTMLALRFQVVQTLLLVVPAILGAYLSVEFAAVGYLAGSILAGFAASAFIWVHVWRRQKEVSWDEAVTG